jgi:glucose-1-phosphate cytidylyltransferase
VKAVIFAGGFGTRLAEETSIRPKPMVEVGNRPILWHIMKIYAAHGINDFVILGGYKVDFIRNWLITLREMSTDFTIDLATGDLTFHGEESEPWRVTVLDTGLKSMTGGRLKRARKHIGEETFCLTYGDGVSDVDITKSIEFHRKAGAWATVTAVSPPGRFGVLRIDGEKVSNFREKDSRDTGFINGGFFVCEPQVFDLIDGDKSVWEEEPMARLTASNKLAAYQHNGFWRSMDTLADKAALERLWEEDAPWRVWK